MNLLKPDVPCVFKKDYRTVAFQVSKILIERAKELHFLNYSQK